MRLILRKLTYEKPLTGSKDTPMIVESQDGKFYLNPQFSNSQWAVVFDGDEPELHYRNYNKKLIGWKTARKPLRVAGIKALRISGPTEDRQILGGQLVFVSAYKLRLTGPIPTPEVFQAVLDSRPADGDFEIISFERKR